MSKLRSAGFGLFCLAQGLAFNVHAQASPASFSGVLGSVNTLITQIPAGPATLGHTSLADYGLQAIPVLGTLQVGGGLDVLESIKPFQLPFSNAFNPDLAGLGGLTKFSP